MRNVLGAMLTGLLVSGATFSAQQPLVEVYKTPTCGCCSKWVEHMRASGFTVRTTNMDSTAPVQNRHGVPPEVRSCHTAVVDGYVVEGHVPVAEVKRLLKERPRITGIAVPGMPAGSPGMEMDGVAPQPYYVVTFDKNVDIQVFAKYPK
jgi:hypothetical protein